MMEKIMPLPLFSIVVPIYGVESYLRQCLDSISVQSFTEWETILVDDGSKDNCPAICDDYVAHDKRFRVIHKPNGGLVSARQEGVSVATGEYVVCVDGDDWIGSEYLKIFADIVGKFNPDVIVCGRRNAKEEGIDEHKCGWPVGMYDRQRMVSEVFPSLIQTPRATYFPPSLWGKAFRRRIYHHQQQMVNTIVDMGEDGACTIPTIYHSQTLYVSNACEYYYRINPTSITNNRKPLKTDVPRIIHEHLCKQIDMTQYDFQKQLYRKTAHELFSVVKSQFYKKQSFWKTRKEVLALIAQEPYKESVTKCCFSGSIVAHIMAAALRYHIMLPVYLFSKMEK